jgi:hypothetical protein
MQKRFSRATFCDSRAANVRHETAIRSQKEPTTYPAKMKAEAGPPTCWSTPTALTRQLGRRESSGLPAILRALDLIRFGGHLPKGGYDVQTNGRQSQAAAQAPAVRF